MVSSNVAHVALSCLKILVSVGLGFVFFSFFLPLGLEGSCWHCRRVPRSVGSGWGRRGRSLDAVGQVWDVGQVADTAILFGLRVRYACYQSRSVIICDLITSTL